MTGLNRCGPATSGPCTPIKHVPVDHRGTVNRFSQSISSVQRARDARRSLRASRRRLEREVLDLASTTQGRRELDSVMSRHTPAQTREVERILTRIAS